MYLENRCMVKKAMLISSSSTMMNHCSIIMYNSKEQLIKAVQSVHISCQLWSGTEGIHLVLNVIHVHEGDVPSTAVGTHTSPNPSRQDGCTHTIMVGEW